jgi:hypothetical protein
MKMMRILPLMLCLLLAAGLRAQSTLSFETKDHDFGTIKEDGGSVSTRFRFANKKAAAVTITDVVVSCGCTSPQWPKQAIAPGDTGSILITFDPMDRPGHFEKFIGVEIDGAPREVIKIHGMVTPRPQGPRDWYPFFMGNLWFQYSNMFVGSIYGDTTVTMRNVVYNASKAPIQIDWEKAQLPGAFVSLQADAATVPPGDSVAFVLTYRAAEKNDWGYVNDELVLPTSDPEGADKKLTAGAIIKERFDPSQPQAKIAVGKEHAFGSVPYQSEHTATIAIANEGQAPLFLRKIRSNCDCLTAELPEGPIAPGQTAQVRITLRTGEQMGWMRKMLTIVSNDPAANMKNFIVTADVQPPAKNGN